MNNPKMKHNLSSNALQGNNLVAHSRHVSMNHDDFQIDDLDELGENDLQPQFESKNKIFELTSKLNNCEYEKNKMSISYENMIMELKKRVSYFENLAATLEQEKQQLIMTIDEETQRSNREVSNLKAELQNLVNNNRLTPNFSAEEQNAQSELIDDIVKKDEIIEELTKQINEFKQANRGSIESFGNKLKNSSSSMAQSETKAILELKETISKLENQNAKIIKELQKFKNQESKIKGQYEKQLENKEELIKRITMQSEDHNKMIAVFKDRTIEDLKKQLFELSINYENSKSQCKLLAEKLESFKNKPAKQDEELKERLKRSNQQLIQKEEKLKSSENQKIELQGKVNQLEIQFNKIKSKKQNLESYIKILEGSNTENEKKKKEQQEDFFRLQNELSEQRTLLFNERLEAKRQLSSFKLEFEEQKFRYIETIEEKNQQIIKIKESSDQKNKNESEMDEIAQKYHQLVGQFQKLSKTAVNLKSQNSNLKNQISNFSIKLDKKNEQFANLRKTLKEEWEVRVKKLEQQLYRLQTKNDRLQSDLINHRNRPVFQYEAEQIKPQVNDQNNYQLSELQSQLERITDINELLKMEKKESDQEIKKLKQKIKKIEEVENQLRQKVKTLESQIKNAKSDYRDLQLAYDEANERYNKLSSLEIEISRMNEEMRREKSQNQSKKRQFGYKEQIQQSTIKKQQQELQHQRRQIFELRTTITTLENQLNKKSIQISIKEQQLTKRSKDIKEIEQNRQKMQSLNSVIDTSKKVAFNSIQLQSKMEEMEKQIHHLQNGKQKDFQNFKNQYKRHCEQKYQQEIQKLNQFIKELQRKCTIQSQKLKQKQRKQSGKQVEELIQKLNKLEQQNYSLKYDYSDSLQETNALLIKYQSLQQKYQKGQNNMDKYTSKQRQFEMIKLKYQDLSKDLKASNESLQNAYAQIERLNKVLMSKQLQISKSKLLTCPHFSETQKSFRLRSNDKDINEPESNSHTVRYRETATTGKTFERTYRESQSNPVRIEQNYTIGDSNKLGSGRMSFPENIDRPITMRSRFNNYSQPEVYKI